MNIHLLSGFLGSGKTTAISNAAISLIKSGKKVGVITNDQGKYQVDGKFINSKGIPVVEVSNGCFCCNYENLDEQIISIDKKETPDYIFAESVGSCTDIVATVLKPLQEYRADMFTTISLSTFTDARMLLQLIKNNNLPFSDDVNYIIQKQYEEADILIVNKIDLMDKTSLEYLRNEVPILFPDKHVLFQNSNLEAGVMNWVHMADETFFSKNREPIDINYCKYGKGEAELGWLDQVVHIEADYAVDLAFLLSDRIHKNIVEGKKPIGHLKFVIDDGKTTWKRSFNDYDDVNSKSEQGLSNSFKAELMINARVATTPEELKKVLDNCLDSVHKMENVRVTTLSQDAFAPGTPCPTHRYA